MFLRPFSFNTCVCRFKCLAHHVSTFLIIFLQNICQTHSPQQQQQQCPAAATILQQNSIRESVSCQLLTDLKMSNDTKFNTNSSSSSNITTGRVVEQALQGVKPAYQVISEVLPIAVVIVLVNSVVFYLFAKRKRLRTPTNCLLLSLAVCDFMTGFIAIPLFVAVVVRVVKPPASVHFGFFIFIFNNALAISAAYHILAITLERYFSIMKPFVHRLLTKKSMFKVALVVWLVSAVISFLPYAWSSKRRTDPVIYFKIQFGYVVFCLTFVFLVPCILIVVSQFLMFKVISKRGRCVMRDASSQRKARQDKKCLIIFALMAMIYLACWLPWFVLSLFFSLWFPRSKETNDVLNNLSQVFGIFRFITSVVNPILYTFFKRDFLEAFKLLVLKTRPAVSRNFTMATQKKTLIRSPDNSIGYMEEREYETVL